MACPSAGLCLFHADDGKQWTHYLADMLRKKELNLTVSTFDGSSEANADGNAHKGNIVKSLLISPGFMSYLQPPLPVWFPRDSTQPVVCILCSVELSEIPEEVISPTWTFFTLEVSNSAVRNLIKSIVKIVDDYETKVSQSPPKVTPVPTPRKPRVTEETPSRSSEHNQTVGLPSRSKLRIQRAHVTKSSNSEEEVFIVFHDQQEENIEVEIKDMKIVPKRLNPYTFVFKAPENLQGKVQMHIWQHDQRLNSYPLLFETADFSSVSYIHLLAQSLRIQPDDKETLDEKLLDILNKTLPSDQSHTIFSNIMADYSDTVDRSKHQLPTLLHFAAANGLKELSCRILELPGSLSAYQLENCQGHDPANLADSAGHYDLAEYLRNYVETKITVDMVDNEYVKMQGHSFLYENTKPQIEDHIDEDLYTAVVSEPATADDDDDDDTTHESVFMEGRPTQLVPERFPKKTVKRHNSEASFRKTSVEKNPPPKSSTVPRGLCFGLDDSTFSQTETPSPGVVGSSSLEELKQIQISFADGKVSIDQVHQLFNAWKMRYGGSTPSFKDRQKALASLRETFRDTLDTVEKSKKKSVFGKLFTRKKDTPKTGSTVDQAMNISMPASRSRTRITEGTEEIHSDTDRDRTSNSSGYSSGVAECRSSGETDGCIPGEVSTSTQKMTARENIYTQDMTQGRRVSKRMRALQDPGTFAVKKAPPVPPRRDTRARYPMPPPPPR